MKKRTLSIAFAMAAIASADNTLGTWTYNAGKSKPAPDVSPITSLTLTRMPAESLYGGAIVSAKGARADGSKIEANYTVKYDGKDVTVTGTGLTFDTVSATQVNDNAVNEMRSKKDGKYKVKVQTLVSKDGKTMTSTTKGTGADGKSFTAVTVYDKQ